MASVLLGLEVIKKEKFSRLKGRAIGLVVNSASLDSGLNSAVEIFLNAKGLKVGALFGPQHGIRGETQDNMIEWEGFRDKKTGLPVYSLYGKTREPMREMMEGIDCLVIDLPDVGARYYTFVWTLALCLRACKKYGKACVVLDRPNPINGVAMEGPVLDPRFSSFVGLYPLPLRHGMTMGEIALYLNREFKIECDLTVVPLKGWQREMWFDETSLPWVMPSPNMPTLDTAIVYPGMCLLEGTTISEGRGTTRPFEIFGKPDVDPDELVKRLTGEDLPGVKFRSLYFQPTFQEYQGELCGGAQIHVTDRNTFLPVLTGVAVIRTMYHMYPESFSWKQPPYEYEEEKLPIDILAGTDELRSQIERGCPLGEIARFWQKKLDLFREVRKPYLIY
ncbi:MAG TPA: DUF1343 domain-containing protein [Thermodesulfobacteriota bacterium]|nr:DUF1343 domain-containing protein [Thermodesulfobacteriota bacterium]